MDRKLLDLLCCPTTRQPLAVLETRGLEALNRAIAAGQVKRADDAPQAEALREALVTHDRKTVYRVEDGIPRRGVRAGQREAADAPGHDPRRGDAGDAPPAADKLPQGGVLGQRVGRLRQLLMQREIFLLQGVQPGHVVPADNAVYPSQRGGPECRQLRQGQQKRGQHQWHGPAPTPPAAA